MATFATLQNGSVDDRVRITFGGKELVNFVSYEVKSGILTQPSSFAVRLGQAATMGGLQKKIKKGDAFELLIGDVPQFSGFVDGFTNSGGPDGGALEIRGRDPIGQLFMAQVEFDTSLTDVTYAELVQKAMSEVGLNPQTLSFDHHDTRIIRAGVKVQTISEPAVSAEVTQQSDGDHIKHVVHAKTGESWLDFIQRHIERAGLFLFAGPYGTLILGRPNGKQKPTYHFVRERAKRRNACNVINHHLVDDATHRFSEAVIFTRVGGRKHGRGIIKGGFVDAEMEALGFKRKRVFRDVNVQSEAQAEFYARRKIAEANRSGNSLRYTLKGHTAPSMVGGGRAVIIPDTVALIDDVENDLHRNWYVESCTYQGGEATTTTIEMMRNEDLVFGKDD